MEVSIKATVSFGEDEEDNNDYYQNYEIRNPYKKNTGRKKLEKIKEYKPVDDD